MRAKSKPSSVLLTALFCGACICAADDASAGNYSVPGTSNPYLAGMPSGSACCDGDSAPAESPVYAGPATAGETFTFTDVTGRVTNYGGVRPFEPPDGEATRRISSPQEGRLAEINDIAGYYRMPIDALVGVFLGPGLPTSNPAPGRLNFRNQGVGILGTTVGTHFTTLSPKLQQIFFIGDGLTERGSGSVQTFVAPAGATRLYLAVADGTQWNNNAGAFDVCMNCGSAVPELLSGSVVPELSRGSVVPEPSTWAMMLLGFGGLGFGGYLRSKKKRLAVLAA
jgi:PEP-CTERM motif